MTYDLHGELLRDLHDFGATQGHIARILNVSVSTVSRWESEDRQPCDVLRRRLERLHSELMAWAVAPASVVENYLQSVDMNRTVTACDNSRRLA